jgi:hypothetical protein
MESRVLLYGQSVPQIMRLILLFKGDELIMVGRAFQIDLRSTDTEVA